MDSINSVRPIAAIGDLIPQDRRYPASPKGAVVSAPQPDKGVTVATPAEVKAAVDAAAQALDQSNQGFSFEFDDTLNGMSIKIIDKRTNTVVRMVPSQQMLAAAPSLPDSSSRGARLKSQA